MTASTVKSASITGFDAQPVTLVPGSKLGNAMREYVETYEVATTSIDEAGDIIRMIRIPSKLRISQILIYNDDLDGHGTPTLAADLGLYRPNGGAVLDADAFASAITTLQSANTAGVNIAFEAQDIASLGKQAWEYCSGVTADPGGHLDVALTVTTGAATAAAGTVSMSVRGTLDN